ncbi:MAG: acyloxyacyl hydrolase [Deltaproteobacteria bacterium]|nr:acyloxyacyl hydrolase [Deltaproteobacteria bacterium]
MIPVKQTASLRLCMGASFHTEEDINFVSVLPYYACRFCRVGSPEDLALAFHFVFEGAVHTYTDPETGVGLGLIPMLRFDLENRYVVPYLGLGVGPYYFSLDVPELGQAWNFLSQAEFGIRFNCVQHLGWHLSYRLQHVSNAGMSDRNSGVNSHLVLLGVSYSF